MADIERGRQPSPISRRALARNRTDLMGGPRPNRGRADLMGGPRPTWGRTDLMGGPYPAKARAGRARPPGPQAGQPPH